MADQNQTPRGRAFNLEGYIDYADGSVVSKTLMKKEIGNITLFAFDRGQGLSEHTALSMLSFISWTEKQRLQLAANPKS